VSATPRADEFPPACRPLPTREELENFLRHYDLGPLRDFHPGRRGRRGRLTTDGGRFWLVGPGMTDAFLETLLEYLAEHHLPVPTVVRARDGCWIRPLGEYPGALVRWPEGRHPERLGAGECAAVGDLLGRIHLAGRGFDRSRDPHRDHRWRRQAADTLAPYLSSGDEALLRGELRFQGLYRHADLPRGIIHGAPNRRRLVFNERGELGLTGFGHACRHALLLDVAIAVNDCCNGTDGRLDRSLSTALLGAYHRRRPLTAIERGAWPTLLRLAALDGWLEVLLLGHDGSSARARLESRIDEEPVLQRHWIT
jgi:homoserine kinase type II